MKKATVIMLIALYLVVIWNYQQHPMPFVAKVVNSVAHMVMGAIIWAMMAERDNGRNGR